MKKSVRPRFFWGISIHGKLQHKAALILQMQSFDPYSYWLFVSFGSGGGGGWSSCYVVLQTKDLAADGPYISVLQHFNNLQAQMASSNLILHR